LKTTNGGFNFIEEPRSQELTFNIYPNPASKSVTISNINKLCGDISVSIYNTKGMLMMNKKFPNKDFIKIDVNKFTRGIYLVKIQNKAGIVTKKLVIE
jgi:hypothetical protein